MKTSSLLLVATIAGLSIATPTPLYVGPEYLGHAAINAPLKNCLGQNTYLGLKSFKDGNFDAKRCEDACNSKANEKNPCVFYNTYVLSKNGAPVAQNCAMYSQKWGPEYATNVGQYRGNDQYTISHSVTYFNAENQGPCQPY